MQNTPNPYLELMRHNRYMKAVTDSQNLIDPVPKRYFLAMWLLEGRQCLETLKRCITNIKEDINNEDLDKLCKQIIRNFKDVDIEKLTVDTIPIPYRLVMYHDRIAFKSSTYNYNLHTPKWLKQKFIKYNVNDIFCMLLRYRTFTLITNENMQLSLLPKFYGFFQYVCKAKVECFASPLNRVLPVFCSAFADVDKVFGSLGSFFDNINTNKIFDEGLFIANPPFVEEVMNKTYDTVVNRLKNNKQITTFMFIVPKWDDSVSIKLLMNSVYYKKHYLLEKAKYYQNYNLQGEIKLVAPCETYIIVLSNFDIDLTRMNNFIEETRKRVEHE